MFFLQFKNSRSKTNKIKKTFSVQDANTPAYTKHTPSQQSLDKASNHSIHSTDKYIHGNHPVNHLQDKSMENTTSINEVGSIENDSSHGLDTTTNDENHFVKDKVIHTSLRSLLLNLQAFNIFNFIISMLILIMVRLNSFNQEVLRMW